MGLSARQTAHGMGHTCTLPHRHATVLRPATTCRQPRRPAAADLRCICQRYEKVARPSRVGLLLGLASATQCQAAAEALPDHYVPGPVEVGPEIWAGVIASCISFAIGSWEFAKRISIQRRCATCQGSGLVMKGRFARKCPECGGFFPWQGWRRFFTSTAAPGNGGPLRAPRGQTSVFYRVPPASQNGKDCTGEGGEAAEGGMSREPEDAVSATEKRL